MNRTLFTCVVFATFFFGAALAKAVPIQFSVDFTPGAFSFFDTFGLTGANIDFEAQLDPATVTPIISGYTETDWPIVAQVTVTGSSWADGTYVGNSSADFYDGISTFGSLQFSSPVNVVTFNGPEFDLNYPPVNEQFPIDIPNIIVLVLPASFSTSAR